MSRLGGLLVVTLRRGLAGKNKTDLATARVLGLRRTGQSVTVPNNSSIRGQISKLRYLVDVELAEQHAARLAAQAAKAALRPPLVILHPAAP